jgi:hypothetical protein
MNMSSTGVNRYVVALAVIAMWIGYGLSRTVHVASTSTCPPSCVYGS